MSRNRRIATHGTENATQTEKEKYKAAPPKAHCFAAGGDHFRPGGGHRHAALDCAGPRWKRQTPDSSPAGETVSARKDGFYTVLLCGTDDGNGGSDTIMLAAVDTETKAIHVVSIPRDTLVNEDWTVKKINSAYNRSGIEGVEEQVEKIVGFPVDFYVTVDLQAFIDLVNAIDGVDFEVPIDMNYDDPAQDLHIHFSAGMQHLDGQEAMEVVRFRHNNDGSGYPLQDLDRIKTQQAFLKTVPTSSSLCRASSRCRNLPAFSLNMWTAT